MSSQLFNKMLASAALAMVGASAGAAPIFWTDWTGGNTANVGFQGQGTITTNTTSIGVTYTNLNGIGFYQPSGGIDDAVLRRGLLGKWQQHDFALHQRCGR